MLNPFLLAFLCLSIPEYQEVSQSSYFLAVMVSAPCLNTNSFPSFLKSLAKHPYNGRKRGDPGHAWILLKGEKEGKGVFYHGGHTGHRSENESSYLELVFEASEKGEPNPAKYLYTYLSDGSFEEGSGGHVPTYAIYVPIEEGQFLEMEAFIKEYPFKKYALSTQNCVYFAGKMASFANLSLLEKTVIPLPSSFKMGGETFPLWKEKRYSLLPLLLPDSMEKKMKKEVEEGRAFSALSWYKKKFPLTFYQKWEKVKRDIQECIPRALRVFKTATIESVPHDVESVVNENHFPCNSRS